MMTKETDSREIALDILLEILERGATAISSCARL